MVSEVRIRAHPESQNVNTNPIWKGNLIRRRRASTAAEDRTARGAGAIGKRFLLDAHRPQDAEMHV